jgi:four helix bundle protein
MSNVKWQMSNVKSAAITSRDLSERLMDFAVRVGKVVDSLPDTRLGRHVAGQLVRCGTSPVPNHEESCAAESRADFVHKRSIVLKELREIVGWLRFIARAQLLKSFRLEEVIDEGEQLKKIFGKSIATTKRRDGQLV